jgi:type II secretory pathway pseudopilin PulG
VTTQPQRPAAPAQLAAFTLTEAAAAIALIGITMTAFMVAMTSLNQSASVARNATGAAAVIQNQIDLILSDGPFNPQKTNVDGTPQIPPELTLGTHTASNVPIYREPATGIVVSGTLTTTVTDMSTTLNGIVMSTYRADVQVIYSYRNKSYNLTRSTLRTSDI